MPASTTLWWVLLAASATAAASIWAHAMWFDELQAWNLARASTSISALFTNLRYEGHPVLWYLPLYALSRWTVNPVAMQAFEWLVLTWTFAVVLLRAPFAVRTRAALVFGYLLFFEYGVISRGYGLGVLLLLLGVMWIARPEPRWGRATAALALLAWTSLAGGVLAIAIAAAVSWGVASEWHAARSPAGGRSRLGFAGATIASALIAGLTCMPPADFVSFSLGIPSRPLGSISPGRLVAAATGPWRGFVPLPQRPGGWNTNLLDGLPHSVGIQALLSVALVVLVGVALRRRALAFRVWVLGAVGIYGFSVAVVLPDRSHYAGMWFLLLVASAWLAVAAAPSSPESGRVRLTGIFAAVLAAQVLATFAIVPSLTVNPFSPHRELARVASAAGLDHALVSAQDYDGVTMAGYLRTPVWSLARNAPIHYFVSDRLEQRGNARLSQTTARCGAAALAVDWGHDVGLVIESDVPVQRGVRLLARSDLVRLYRVSASAAAGCA